jgi:hypothetical protein
MPPSARDPRKLALPPGRGPLVVPEFTEAGVILAITYSIRDGRRGEFFDLMKELKPLLAGIGGTDCTVYEDRSRPNYFMEVFRFRDETEFTAFDDKFHKDRRSRRSASWMTLSRPENRPDLRAPVAQGRVSTWRCRRRPSAIPTGLAVSISPVPVAGPGAGWLIVTAAVAPDLVILRFVDVRNHHR